jgi:hypothetical protein
MTPKGAISEIAGSIRLSKLFFVPLSPDELSLRLQDGVGGPSIWKLRLETIDIMSGAFSQAGAHMLAKGTESIPPSEHVFAFGLLLTMAGDLLSSTVLLAASKHFYSAAALVRQIVEIEYLTWAFKEKQLTPQAWLNSTHRERQNIFSPRELRKTSKGRFLDKDYREHCESGGHPIPKGMSMFSSTAAHGFQVLAVDVITHGWRTWDQTLAWSAEYPAVSQILDNTAEHLALALKSWGTQDKIYQLMCEHSPA